MSNRCKALAIILLFVTVGCSHLIDENEVEDEAPITVNSSFTGTIIEITDNTAIVHATLGGGEGKVFVNLSVNSDETFQVGDEVKVGFDGVIMESNPAQINTLSVELIK